MKILLRIAVVAVAGTLIAGCCNCRAYQKKARRPLVGTEWQLIQLGGETIRPEKGTFTLTLLAEGNRLSGVYKTDDKRTLKMGPIASTMMACPGMEREHAFAQALEATTHYDMDGPMLLLLSDGELRAVFQAMP